MHGAELAISLIAMCLIRRSVRISEAAARRTASHKRGVILGAADVPQILLFRTFEPHIMRPRAIVNPDDDDWLVGLLWSPLVGFLLTGSSMQMLTMVLESMGALGRRPGQRPLAHTVEHNRSLG
jgi:hypothetical protein